MITLDDMITRFGEEELAELTDRQNYQIIDVAVVNKAIADAISEAESYLNATGLVSRHQGVLQYQLGAVPQPLVIRLCDMARYYLHDDSVTPVVKERYEQAIAWLKLVIKNPTMLTGVTITQGKSTAIAVIANAKPDMWRD
ncbi:phage protein Gp36 family protein [Acinetobacter sp. c3-l95]|uniref:phage protein Gp36 family protein n=1 Tax=Acinetobacter sp. c3-l95 TaxID=3342804 RepID=UPI0035B6B079